MIELDSKQESCSPQKRMSRMTTLLVLIITVVLLTTVSLVMFKKWMDMKNKCLELEEALESAELSLKDEEGCGAQEAPEFDEGEQYVSNFPLKNSGQIGVDDVQV